MLVLHFEALEAKGADCVKKLCGSRMPPGTQKGTFAEGQFLSSFFTEQRLK